MAKTDTPNPPAENPPDPNDDDARMLDPAPVSDEARAEAVARALADGDAPDANQEQIESEFEAGQVEGGHGLTEMQIRELPENDKGDYHTHPSGDPAIDSLCTQDVIGVVFVERFSTEGMSELRARRVYDSLAQSLSVDETTGVRRNGWYWNPWTIVAFFNPEGPTIYKRGQWMEAGFRRGPRFVGFSNRTAIGR